MGRHGTEAQRQESKTVSAEELWQRASARHQGLTSRLPGRFLLKPPPAPPRKDQHLPHVIMSEKRNIHAAAHQVGDARPPRVPAARLARNPPVTRSQNIPNPCL